MKTTFNHKGINYELEYKLEHNEIDIIIDGKDLCYEDEDLFLEIFAASEFHIIEQQELVKDNMRQEYYESQLQEEYLNYELDHGY